MLTTPSVRQRRKHSPEFKSQLVAVCQPNVSVAAVALEHGVNANLLRRWIRQFPPQPMPPAVPSSATLIPVRVSAPIVQPTNEVIELNIQKNGVGVDIRWPAHHADACARWLSDRLK